MSDPELAVYLFGPPRIEREGVVSKVDTRKAIALLAYLSVTSAPHSRDALSALLWEDYPQDRARGALRRTLSTLRSAVGPDRLFTTRDIVELKDGETLIDVRSFDEAVGEPTTHPHSSSEVCSQCVEPLERAVALQNQSFLQGFSVRDSFAFDDWQSLQAESYRRRLDGVLEKLTRALIADGELERALPHASRWVALDPLQELAHRRLMEVYGRLGRRSDALRQYRECVLVLDRELGVAPLDETTRVYLEIKEGRIVEEPAIKSPSLPVPDRPLSLPLTGRTEALDQLSGAFLAAAGGHVAVIEGEAGIGKTRLAEEFLSSVRARGGVVLSARCHEDEANLAHAPLIEMLASVAPSKLQHLDEDVVAEASRLQPGLAPGRRFHDVPLDTPGARRRFFDAVIQVLVAATTGASPGVLFIDDLHWADDASLDALTFLVRRLEGKSILLLFAWRPEGMPEGHRLRRAVIAARREGIETTIPLRRLGASEVAELARSALHHEVEYADRLYEETEGVPFFVAEYLAASGESWDLPRGVEDLLRARVGAVGEVARQLLAASAVMGRTFDFESAREVSGRGEEETVRALEELLAAGMIKEGKGLEPTYDFNHEKTRAFVYSETQLARRRLLHRRAAESLQGRRGPPALAAHHYQMAGVDEQAAQQFLVAAASARLLYANADALAHLRSAIALGVGDRSELHEAAGDLCVLLGRYAEAINSYETAAAHAGGVVASLEHKIAGVNLRLGEWEVAAGYLEIALEGEGSGGERARILADQSLVEHRLGRADEATRLAGDSLALAEDAGDAPALAQAHNILGILRTHSGDLDGAREHLETSLDIAGKLTDRSARIAAMNNLALALRADGDVDGALKLAGLALAECAEIGDLHREAALHSNLADLLHAADKRDDALEHLKKAAALFSEVGEDPRGRPEIWKLVEW